MKSTAALLIALLSGCATVPRDGGIADVQREVAARTNQTVEVRSAASNTDDDRVRTMLGGELDADKVMAIALMNNPRVSHSPISVWPAPISSKRSPSATRSSAARSDFPGHRCGRTS